MVYRRFTCLPRAGGVLISSLAFSYLQVLGVKVIARHSRPTVEVRRLLRHADEQRGHLGRVFWPLALVAVPVLFSRADRRPVPVGENTKTTALLAAGSASLMRRFPYREPRGLVPVAAIAGRLPAAVPAGPLAPGLAVAAAAGCAPPLPARWRRPLWSASRWRRPLRRPALNLFATAALAVALGSLAAACLYPGERLRCAGVFAAGLRAGGLGRPDAAGVLPLFLAGRVGLVDAAWGVVVSPPAPPVQTQGLARRPPRLAGVAIP